MYVDFEYYRQNSKLKPPNDILEKDAQELIELAEVKIDEVTFNRIKASGFEKLTEFQQICIKKAVCLQADYIFETGGNYQETESPIQSYSVLDINITAASGQPSQAERLAMAPLALALLRQTGLMRRSF